MEYSGLVIPKAAKTATESAKNKESAYWRGFKSSVFINVYSPVTHVQLSGTRFVVTSGTKLQIFSTKTNKVVKNISRFKENARSGEIRSDGKLCVAGDESGLVQVFDVNSRAVLRSINVHKLPINSVVFSPNGTQLLTASSDKSVRLFDLATASELGMFYEHGDYVRKAVFVNDHLVLSGGYDGTVRLWDTRTNEEVWVGRHGKPVEDVLVNASGTQFISAGGPYLIVWDLISRTTVKTMANHTKTITSLCWAEMQGATRLLSAGLDGLVKVYDPENGFRVRHTMRYSGQILSIAAGGKHLVTGLSDGSISIRARNERKNKNLIQIDEKKTLPYEVIFAGQASAGVVIDPKQEQNEQHVSREKKRRLQPWDRLMKEFRYADALDTVLAQQNPAIKFALLTELIQRNVLHLAVANRHDLSLEPLLTFLSKYVTSPQYHLVTKDTLNAIFDIYASIVGLSPLIDSILVELLARINKEIELQNEITKTRGALEMIAFSH